MRTAADRPGFVAGETAASCPKGLLGRMKDRAVAAIGGRTRAALLALGLGISAGGVAVAEEPARPDTAATHGARTEEVRDAALAPDRVVVAKADVAAAPATLDVGKAAEAVPAVAAKSRTVGIAEFAKGPKAAEYGITGAFSDAYVAYRAQLADWRKANPEAARSYESRMGEVLSAYVLEGRFADVRYPENVVDLYNRAERVDAGTVGMDTYLTADVLRAKLPGLFTVGIDDAWATRQAALENPVALDGDGAYKAAVILEDTRDTMARRAKRWEAKLWPDADVVAERAKLEKYRRKAVAKPDDAALASIVAELEKRVKDAEARAKPAMDAKLAERAAASLNALHALYAAGMAQGNQTDFNPAAVIDERTAALSWTAVRAGFGEERPDALRLQKDLATLTIAWQARRNPEAMERVPLLHLGRVKGPMAKNAGERSYADVLLEKAKAAVSAEVWADLRQQVPAGAEKGDAMHDECTLRLARDDARVPAAVRADIRQAMAPSVDVPLVSAEEVMVALAGYSRLYAERGLAGKPGTPDAMTGQPGTDAYARDLALVRQLIPAAFAGAMGLSEEIDGDQKITVAGKAAMAAWKKADQSARELAGVNARLAAVNAREAEIDRRLEITNRLEALLDAYDKGDVDRRRSIAKELTDIITVERAKIMAKPEDQREDVEKKKLMVYALIEAKISGVLAKNG